MFASLHRRFPSILAAFTFGSPLRLALTIAITLAGLTRLLLIPVKAFTMAHQRSGTADLATAAVVGLFGFALVFLSFWMLDAIRSGFRYRAVCAAVLSGLVLPVLTFCIYATSSGELDWSRNESLSLLPISVPLTPVVIFLVAYKLRRRLPAAPPVEEATSADHPQTTSTTNH